jgi:hypothetical protein
MKNLAGNKDADKFIKEELYLAGIPEIKIGNTGGEVPYTIIGKLGNWTFTRAWYYWVARVENPKDGLKLDKAIALHKRKHPTNDKMKILGNVIRSGGHCGCPSPAEYGSQPVYDENFDKTLTELGYKKKHHKIIDVDYWDLPKKEIIKLCNEGKITMERYVDCYHIDDQVGLVEFAKVIAADCYKHCGNTMPSPDNKICLSCGSGIITINDCI